MERLLAAEETAPLDYTIFSVVILTLCIVLVVEVLRHQLDVAASGNPFFQTVLELMYRELTTLGIVEFFIYLLHKYDENFNYAMEVVFVDVHFMLFYTALFNAIQSVLVRLLTSRRTDKAWIQTEDIDIGHYVAIRKEFDRVENEWKRLHYKKGHVNTFTSSMRSSSMNTSNENDEEGETQLSKWDSIRRLLHDSFMKLRYPRLYMRKRKLLVPVRFHELRCHFIEQNGLSSKFKVSQYLKRSLTSVLLDFVHISSAAWIMVMALGILLYYISGIILNVSENEMNVYEFLAWTLGSGVILFLAVAVVLFTKMRSIISKILVMKLTIEDDDAGKQKNFKGFTALRTKMKSYDQINLFWAGNPHIIIVLTQFMQFGYALGLAAIFTYWQQFEHNDFKDKLLVALIISYGFFLHLLSDILPWFTVCTSLGQLVNKERLYETMAKLKLSEELRKEQAAAEAAAIEKEIALKRKRTEEKLQAKKMREDFTKRVTSRIKEQRGSGTSRQSRREKSLSRRGVGLMRLFDKNDGNIDRSTPSRHEKRKSFSDGVQLMSNLQICMSNSSETFNSSARLSDAAAEQLFYAADSPTMVDKDDHKVPIERNCEILRTDQLNGLKGNSSVEETIVRNTKKHRRIKSKSEGVASMRSFPDTGINFMESLSEDASEEAKLGALSELVKTPAHKLPQVQVLEKRRDRRSRLKAISEGVSLMQAEPLSNDISNIPQSTKSSVCENSYSFLDRHDRKQRRMRMKCQSEGVASMRSSLGTANMSFPLTPFNGVITQQQKLETLSELVNIPTKDLPEVQKEPRRERKSRIRAISDGVSLMSAEKTYVESKLQGVPIELETTTQELAAQNPCDQDILFSEESNLLLTDTSVNSVDSVNGDSDIDDVPVITLSEKATVLKKKNSLATFDLALFFQGHQYHRLSLLFGPMMCSFFIAMRVEGFNMMQGVLIDYDNTFHFSLTTCFWLETTWYCLMLLERFIALVVFRRNGNPKEVISAIIGIFSVVTCLTLFVIAERERCCLLYESNEGRILAPTQRTTDEAYTDSSTVYTDCSCSSFGSRTYGGLGQVEPFTFLIALGPLRFLSSGPIARLFRMKTVTETTHKYDTPNHHHETDREAVRHIWLKTIGLHTAIAKQYGIFSLQILYCMLGLEIPAEWERQAVGGDSAIELNPSTTFRFLPESDKTSESASYQDTPLKNSLGIAFDENEFSFPDSKLIRRMRRCERRLLPLLDIWILVDVVITNHELVLLEVPDDECFHAESADIFGDGGKGLRLSEVVKGRKVVSKFMLNEIDCIDIEHSLSIPTDTKSTRDVESNCQQLGEFWQGCTDALAYDADDMSKRWCHVDEDRLKIHFTGGCGTLYLRLLADLKEKEDIITSISTDNSPSLLANVGSETKIWCRTIARLCGVANLKMELPHFGESVGDDELGDFIKFTNRDSNGIKQQRKRLSRMQSPY